MNAYCSYIFTQQKLSINEINDRTVTILRLKQVLTVKRKLLSIQCLHC